MRFLITLALFVCASQLSSVDFAQAKTKRWNRYLEKTQMNFFQPGNWYRMVMHIHSVFSHDACDGKPQKTENGKIIVNQPCLQDLKKALCDHHIDITFLTEHRTHMADVPFNEMMTYYNFDELHWEGESVVSARLSCPSGHQVFIIPGAENKLMPVGLIRHPDTLPELSLKKTYNSYSAETVKVFREAGALVGVNHLEDKRNSLSALEEIKPDFVELYNTHANIEYVYGDRNPFKILRHLGGILELILNPANESDLFYLDFLRLNDVTLDRWAWLAQRRRVTGVGGSDVHQNAIPIKIRGDRPDSYRRTLRWMSNYIQVRGKLTRKRVLHAIRAGRVYAAFDVFGSPDDVEFKATNWFQDFPMGSVVPASTKNLRLVLEIPRITRAKTFGRIFRATDSGWKLVAESDRHLMEYTPKKKGVYRAEVLIRPKHLAPLMPMRFLEQNKKYPWILSNPIYIR